MRKDVIAVRDGHIPSLPPAPSRTLPPADPPGIPAVGQAQFPDGTRCVGTEIAVATPMSAPPEVKEIVLTGVAPRSRFCFRDYQGRWRSKRAGSDGTAHVPVRLERPGVGSLNEILTQQPGGAWSKVILTRIAQEREGTTPPEPPDRTWMFVAAGGALAALALAAWATVRHCRRRHHAAFT